MSWQNWQLAEWNQALIESVFFNEKQNGTKLSRIDASSRFLSNLTKDNTCAPEEAKRKFVSSFGDTLGLLRWQFKWPGPNKLPVKADVYPACFAALYLSLLAATADNETSGTGDFRQRFADILKFIEPHSVDFSNLPKMWELVGQWSQVRYETHKDCAILIIPKAASHEKLIGISKRIAFPTYKDEIFLRKILSTNNLSGDSAFSDVIKVISIYIRNFSSSNFEDEFKLFLKFCYQQDYKKAYESPFWGAIKDISFEQENESSKIKGINNLTLDISDFNEINFYLYIDEILNNKKIIPSKPLNFQRRDKCKYIAYVDDNYPNIDIIEKWINDNPENIGSRISKQVKNGWIVFFPDEFGELSNEGSYFKDSQVALLIKNGKSNNIENYLKRNLINHAKITNQENIKNWDLFIINKISQEYLIEILDFAPNTIRNLSKIGWSPERINISSGSRFGYFYLLNPASNPQAYMPGAVKGIYIIKNSKNEVMTTGELSSYEDKFQIHPTKLIDEIIDIDNCEYILYDKNQNQFSKIIKITSHFIEIDNLSKLDQRIWIEDSKEGILNSEALKLDNLEILNNFINKNKEFLKFTNINIGKKTENTDINNFKNIHKSQIWLGNALQLRFQKRNNISFDILKEHTLGVSEIYNISKSNINKSLFYGQWLIPIINKDGPYTAIRKGDLLSSVVRRNEEFYFRIVGPLSNNTIININNKLATNEIPYIYTHENGYSISCIEIKIENLNRAVEISKNINSKLIDVKDYINPLSALNKNQSKVQRFNNSPLNTKLESWNSTEWKWHETTSRISSWNIGEIKRTTGRSRSIYWIKLRNDLYIKTDSIRWSWIFSNFVQEENSVNFSNNGHIYWHKNIPELPSSLTKWWMLFGGGCISILSDGTTVFAGPSSQNLLKDMGWTIPLRETNSKVSIAQQRLKLALRTKLKKSKYKFN